MFVVSFRMGKYGSDCISRRITGFGLEKSRHSFIFQRKYKYSTMSIRSISLGNESIYQTFYPQFYHGTDL